MNQCAHLNEMKIVEEKKTVNHNANKWANRQSITYQPYCMRLCVVNDFLRRPALCGLSCLRPGRNKKRIVRVGEQLRWRAKGRGRRKGGI